MKFDPRYAILAVLLILAVVKITMKKEPYMCGGKREGYKSSGGPKMVGRKPPIMGNKAVKRKDTVLNVVPVVRPTANRVNVLKVVRKGIAVHVVTNKRT